MFKNVAICALAMGHLSLYACITVPFMAVGYLFEFARLGFGCGIEAHDWSNDKIKQQGDS